MDLKVCIFLVANILCVSKYVSYIYMHRIYIYIQKSPGRQKAPDSTGGGAGAHQLQLLREEESN